MEDLGSIPGLGRSLGEGKGYPLQYSGLENPMDCIVHGVSKESDMTERLSFAAENAAGLRFIKQFHMEFPHDPAISFTSIDPGEVMEKAMAPHSSTLAWKIPWTEEPVRLQSMGSLRVRHD